MSAPPQTDRRVSDKELRTVALSSLLGTAMEWYDYFLYGLFAALIFNELFFPNLDPTVGTILALLSFAVGFIARPLGAVIFGHLGDRIGRKRTLVATLLLIGVSTGCIGLLPTYDTIGVAAPVLLATLRFLQGLSLGGEWGGAVLMAVEHAPAKKRAFYGAMPQYGSPIGTITSSGVVALVSLLPREDLLAWGWRLPFLLSFVLLCVALYVRLRVEESPVFSNLVMAEEPTPLPVLQVFRKAGGRVLIVIIMSLFASGGFFLMTTYAVNYGTKVLQMPAWMLLVATMIGAVLEAAGIYFGGRLADTYHPWKVVALSAACAAVLTVPIVFMIGSGNPVLVIAAIALGIGAIGVPYGPLGTLLSQLFEDQYRYSGVAVSYNISGLIGGFVPTIALAVSSQMNGSVWAIGLLLGAIMSLAAIGGFMSGNALKRKEALSVG